jgi:hypothetical protein
MERRAADQAMSPAPTSIINRASSDGPQHTI